MKNPKYHCKQAELYTIAYFILQLVSSILVPFSKFKGKYVAAYISGLILQVEAAEAEPDEEQRTEQHVALRVELVKLLNKALSMFNAMERYIPEVFDKEVQEAKIKAAGGTQYSAAYNEDFDACAQMLKDLSKFTADNETTLLNGGLNMPADYRAKLDTLKADFKDKHLEFLGAEGGAQIGTDSKIDLNNKVYEQIVTAINADAQVIFEAEADEAIRKQFVFEHQLFLVRGAGIAGFRLHAIDSLTSENVADVTVAIKNTDKVFTTDEKGRLLALQLKAGNYELLLSKTGYVTQNIPIEIETGTVKRINAKLLKTV